MEKSRKLEIIDFYNMWCCKFKQLNRLGGNLLALNQLSDEIIESYRMISELKTKNSQLGYEMRAHDYEIRHEYLRFLKINYERLFTL